MITLEKKNYGGIIKAPSSKSDGHRALICAALAREGTSIISNVYFSNDIIATMKSLESLGASFEVKKDTIIVHGIKNKVINPVLDCSESGSTLRFLIPLATEMSVNPSFKTSGRLSKRPLDVYEDIYSKQNISFYRNDTTFYVEGNLKPGLFEVDGSISSQFISGLLFTLPLLNGDSIIKINNNISSLSYIYMTFALLEKFGIKYSFSLEQQTITIPGNQKFKATNYVVENDFSQAAFLLSLGALTTIVTVKENNLNSYQPDKNIINILKDMGVSIQIEGDSITTSKSKIKGCTISLDENPDLGPILMGLATFADSDVKFVGIKRLRIKESDRVEAMRDNLNKLGINMEILDEDTCIVHPGPLKEPNEILNPYHDHRIFITLAIITYNLNVKIDDEECIKKSYPTFLEDLKSLELE